VFEIGLTTNEKGFFSLYTDEDSVMISVDAVGYTNFNQSYNANKDDFIYVSLDKKSIELSPIEVIADRTSLIGATKNFFRIAGSSSLISKAEVIEFNDTDINRVISQVPGIYTQEEDGYGLRPNIGMRGSGLERSAKINMMEDGIPIAPAPYSSPAAYYSPTAGRMESFEIRKGSSQVKYGPHSTGGAINYISASIPDQLKFQGIISTGSFGNRLGKFKTGVSNKV
jgi:Fe(3+) dicitrate transport protein